MALRADAGHLSEREAGLMGRGVKNMGSSHATSGVCQGQANHWLSARRRIAKAQKVLPEARSPQRPGMDSRWAATRRPGT